MVSGRRIGRGRLDRLRRAPAHRGGGANGSRSTGRSGWRPGFLRARANTWPSAVSSGLSRSCSRSWVTSRARASARNVSGSVSASQAGLEDLDQLVERLEPRLVARARAVHESGDLAGQPLRLPAVVSRRALRVDGRCGQFQRARRRSTGSGSLPSGVACSPTAAAALFSPQGARHRPGPGRSGP